MRFFSLCVFVFVCFFVLPAFALTDSDGDGYYGDDRRLRYKDCDDGNSAIYPGAREYCDGVDNNCNRVIDEPRSADATTWYQDSDGDGYGNSSSRRRTCSAPTGYVADNTDCNDSDSAINPGVNEAVDGVESDGVDNNCDGYTDEIDVPASTSITLSSGTASYHEYVDLEYGSSLTFDYSPVTLTTESLTGSFGTITVSDSTCSGAGGGSNGGGSADGGGGGGGSHVGLGGAGGHGGWTGTSGSGGSVYGSADDFVAEVGSCGGNGGGPYGGAGGVGGGAITITANTVDLWDSYIIADGADGNNALYDDGGGAGASGGSIVIIAGDIDLGFAGNYSLLSVAGGNGGNGGSSSSAGGGGGGGGGGGSVELSYTGTLTCWDGPDGDASFSPADFASAVSCLNYHVNVSGGTGGSGGGGTASDGVSGADGRAGSLNSSIDGSTEDSYFDATADFSETSNPNDVWSAGWSASPTGTLNIYPDSVVSGCGFSDWTDSSIEIAGTPSFAKNTSASTCTGIPPGFVTLHPGCNADEYSVLRWTSPLDAECDVSINLYGGDSGETDASILLNGALLDYFSATSASPSYTGTLTVSSGDIVDLAVGDLGDCSADSTPFDFVVDCR